MAKLKEAKMIKPRDYMVWAANPEDARKHFNAPADWPCMEEERDNTAGLILYRLPHEGLMISDDESVTESTAKRKPNVQELMDAFQEWQTASRHALVGPIGSWWGKLVAAQETFRVRMKLLGLEDAIDWSDWTAEK